MRVMHLLHRSVPGTSGYSIRSRMITNWQSAAGIEPLVVTSPSQAPLGELDRERSEWIEGVRYFRTCSAVLAPSKEIYDPSRLRSLARVAQNVFFLQRVHALARRYRPRVIHAHSPFTCGLIANRVGHLLGIPTVYELRGLWEDSHVSRHGLGQRSLIYRTVRGLETLALRGADCCCVISEGLRGEVASRGIDPQRIAMVPNGVDPELFTPGPPAEDLKRGLGFEGRTVMGYLGSFMRYEGLELLVRAAAMLAPELPDLRLLMVGDGEVLPELRRTAAEAGVAERVVFTGKVPHHRVLDYYRLYDLMVLPRVETRETRLVTPLKALEVMAMGIPLVASDVGGHRELVIDGVGGLLFRAGDLRDLAARCRSLLVDPAARDALGSRARQWVQENRSWSVLGRRYLELYERLS